MASGISTADSKTEEKKTVTESAQGRNGIALFIDRCHQSEKMSFVWHASVLGGEIHIQSWTMTVSHSTFIQHMTAVHSGSLHSQRIVAAKKSEGGETQSVGNQQTWSMIDWTVHTGQAYTWSGTNCPNQIFIHSVYTRWADFSGFGQLGLINTQIIIKIKFWITYIYFSIHLLALI